MKFTSRTVAMLVNLKKIARWQPNVGSGSDWLMVMEKTRFLGALSFTWMHMDVNVR